MKPTTLKILQYKNPELTSDEIKLIINRHLVTINKRIKSNYTLDITIPKFGRIHTHKNAVDVSKKKLHKAQIKCHKRTLMFSDKVLLF